jgi:wobble nucleotide-excising tRNase
MIESISLANEASYGDTPVVLPKLSKHNFFYGANGTGKTTITRVIADETSFPTCQVSWTAGTKLQALVYNRDFVEKNFNQSSELKGIFTLGEKDESILQKIKDAKKECDDLDDKIKGLKNVLNGEDGTNGKQGELKTLEDQFTEKCWAYKTKFDDDFKDAFEGVRGKRADFKNRLISESQNNKAELLDLDGLKSKAKTIFGTAPEKASVLSTLDFASIVASEANPILLKKVIGSADVDIAELIQHLGNSDWVKEGQQYLDSAKGRCPFCQQGLPETFAEKLTTYFDETFEKDIDAIKKLASDYEQQALVISVSIQSIIDSKSIFIDIPKVQASKDLFDAKISTNKRHIATKLKESSKVVSLEPLEAILQSISSMAITANEAIAAHNLTVDNLADEKSTLKQQVWKYVVTEANADYSAYVKAKNALDKAVEGLTKNIRKREAYRIAKRREMAELEKSITSIKPTVDAINGILTAFGFSGFSLAMSDKDGYYKIIRDDGGDAKDSLSEGEKTFITFLYFYHLLKGSDSESGITGNRVVVFDDPVSSLDSEILFIVSSLIKGLLEEVRSDAGHIKQIFVLTHNVYFHKEVTFNSNRKNGAMNHETFWIIKKPNNRTEIIQHNDNSTFAGEILS